MPAIPDTHTPRRSGRATLLLIGAGLLVLIGGLFIADRVIVQNMAWNDTIPRYEGCRAFFAGESPYAPEVTARIQARLPEFTGDEQRFAYPAHLCLVLLPIWLLPYRLAAAVWILALLLCFLLLPLIVIRSQLGMKLAAPRFGLLALVGLLGFRYTMMTIVLGQYSGLVLMGLVGAGWALAARKPIPASLALIAMTVRPEGAIMAAALVGLALLHGEHTIAFGERRVALGWAGGLALLWLGTRLFIGAWEAEFLAGIAAYAGYNPGARGLLAARLLGAAGTTVIALFTLGWAWFILRRVWRAPAGLFWATSSAVIAVAGLLLIPQTNPYTLVYLLPGFFMVFQVARERWLAWALLIGWAVLPWGLFAGGSALAGVDQVLLPALLAIGLGVAFWKQPAADALNRSA